MGGHRSHGFSPPGFNTLMKGGQGRGVEIPVFPHLISGPPGHRESFLERPAPMSPCPAVS